MCFCLITGYRFSACSSSSQLEIFLIIVRLTFWQAHVQKSIYVRHTFWHPVLFLNMLSVLGFLDIVVMRTVNTYGQLTIP